MPFKKILPLVAALLIAMSTVVFAAAQEDMRFVDANGSTGYYVDVASISFDGDDAVNARIAVVKAAANRRFIYAVRFDRKAKTYQLYSSIVQQYDTKEVLEDKPLTDSPHPYGIASPMKEMVDFIFQFPHND